MANIKVSTPAGELQLRIFALQEALLNKGADGALVVQKSDLFYFAGTSQQGWLYVPAEGDPLLLIFKEFDRAERESALKRVAPLTGIRGIPGMLAEYGCPPPKKIGMELDVLPVNQFFQFQELFATAAIVDISLEIRLIRAVKSPYELELMRQAAARSDQVSLHVPLLLEEGKPEVTLAGEIEAYARSLGHQGIVRMRLWGAELFYGHLMSGVGAAVPSYLASPTGGEGVSPAVGQGPGFKAVRRDEPILVDYVFAWKGYLADHTRIFCMGALPAEMCRAHEAMLEIQNQARKSALPGVVSGELYQEMLAAAEQKGYGRYFMGASEPRIRFTGHGIGLELDEFPFIARNQKIALREGMVVALEPKIVIPGKGVVGIENTHVVTGSGLEPLTHAPDDIMFLG